MADLSFDLPELPPTSTDEVPFDLGDESYRAVRPGEFAFERIYAALSPTTTNADKVQAVLRFLDAAIVEEDRARIEARMADPDDPLRSYTQLFDVAFGLCEYWGADTSEMVKPDPVVRAVPANRAQRRAVTKAAPRKTARQRRA